MMRLDHLAVSCATLDAGADHVEAALGVRPGPGGTHALMGTHNLLLNLGELYLEVIAVDPGALAPLHPRWFDLDRFAGPPRLSHWVAACDDLDAEVARGPQGIGRPLALVRGDLRWRMAVPPDGRLPFDGGCPALIEWEGSLHPAAMLPDLGLRLARLTVTHPRAGALVAALDGRVDDARLAFAEGPPALRAEIETPSGRRVLE